MKLVRNTGILLLNKFLSKNSLLKQYPGPVALNAINSRCCISKSNKFIYFRIPKAANSTIISSLYYAETGTKPTNQQEMNRIKKSYHTPGFLRKHEIARLYSYYKFSFVRNPYNRVISAYADKIVRAKAPKQKVSTFFGREIKNTITMDEFIYYLENGGIEQDPHWALQTDLIIFPLNSLDYLGKVENIDNDLPLILKSIFGTNQIVNWKPHASNDISATIQLSNSLKARIYAIYEKDFQLLKYNK